MLERDERPLAEIRFAQDTHVLSREAVQLEVCSVLQEAGVRIAQDIIELGCTGLVLRLQTAGKRSGVEAAIFVREHMAGSICGLPCYVPPDCFCLVHNTVGALQLQGNADGPQLARHPEGIPLCSRELTEDERKKLNLIQSKIAEDATDEARRMGAEVLTATEFEEQCLEAGLPYRPLRPGLAVFKCIEHTEFNPKCRFCLAQAVVDGPLDPLSITRQIEEHKGTSHVDWCVTAPNAVSAFKSDGFPNYVVQVELYVLAARWVRKLTRE
jgi:hypothetical protein